MKKNSELNPKLPWKNSNKQLVLSRQQKDDEFYTDYNVISAEICNYKNLLKNKHIVCCCDWNETIYQWKLHDIEKYKEWVSGGGDETIPMLKHRCNFVKFLELKKEEYGILTIDFCGYDPNSVNSIEYFEDNGKSINDGIRRFEESLPFFKGKYKKDIVVITNPPFSKFREFVNTIIFNELDFIILGAFNATNYKNIFQYLLSGKINRGFMWHKSIQFLRPDGSKKSVGCSWYTSFSGQQWQKNYHICNYSLEEVKKTKYFEIVKSKKDELIVDIRRCTYIPNNYLGKMEVPISFFDVWNKDQFDIIGNNNHPDYYPEYDHMKLPSTNASPFFSLIIKWKESWINSHSNIKWVEKL